jgi:pimeloyl-ACP methyl ester carboxylesterase
LTFRWRIGLTAGVAAALVVAALPAQAQIRSGTQSSETSLRWHTCTDELLKGVECATLTVPLDWRNPGSGQTFELPVGRIKASGPRSERIGVLTFNVGGPGGASLEALKDTHSLLPNVMQRRFDVVTWNPRGTTGTKPATTECPAPEIPWPETGLIDWSEIAASFYDNMTTLQQACLETNAAIAPYLGTWMSARDIDALRQRLGERQLSFWGMSYGTTMGRIYAQTFPNRVRALLLDGAIDPTATTGSYAREQIWSNAMGMARMMQWFTPGVRAAHRRVTAELNERTLTTSWGVSITRFDFALRLAELSGSQRRYEVARKIVLVGRDALFAPTERERTRATDSLAELLTLPGPDDPIETSTQDFVLPFVNCADLPERIDKQEVVTITVQAAKNSGIASGASAMAEATMCAGLPNFGVPIEQRSAIRIPTPPIVLNAVADPRTVLLGATLMANAFPSSRLITYDSSQHVSYRLTSAPCVNRPVTHYFLTQQLPKRDIACSLRPPFESSRRR